VKDERFIKRRVFEYQQEKWQSPILKHLAFQFSQRPLGFATISVSY